MSENPRQGCQVWTSALSFLHRHGFKKKSPNWLKITVQKTYLKSRASGMPGFGDFSLKIALAKEPEELASLTRPGIAKKSSFFLLGKCTFLFVCLQTLPPTARTASITSPATSAAPSSSAPSPTSTAGTGTSRGTAAPPTPSTAPAGASGGDLWVPVAKPSSQDARGGGGGAIPLLS